MRGICLDEECVVYELPEKIKEKNKSIEFTILDNKYKKSLENIYQTIKNDVSKDDIKLLDWYARQPYTILFVDANHENHTMLTEYSVEEWCGGTIHRIRPNLIHLMRGQYYTIDGKTFLTMGGAVSTDRALRTENVDWWAAEIPNAEEIATLRQTMEEHNYTVDYIITHCAPTTVLPALNPYFEQDEMTQLLDEVYYSMDFKYWYFGHYHLHRPAKQKTFCLYNKVIEVED